LNVCRIKSNSCAIDDIGDHIDLNLLFMQFVNENTYHYLFYR